MRGRKISDEEFAARHADRLNYDLVKVLGRKQYVVKCRDCGKKRTIESTNSHLYGSCKTSGCKKVRKPVVVRTPKLHTKEIHEIGRTDYISLKVQQNPFGEYVYKHLKCGLVFKSTRQTFVSMKREPCPDCRDNACYSNEDYLKVMKKFSKFIVPLEPYKPLSIAPEGIRHQYVKCGHTTTMRPKCFTSYHAPIRRCKVCHKSSTWFKFKIRGKVFITRSLIEKEFIKFLLSKGIHIDRIEYEPKDSRVSYFNPVRDKMSTYTPDFKVGDVRFEVKSLASLGLMGYKWQTQEEALIENRAKCLAASKEFDDYRIYVHIKGKFYRAKKFWNPSEQNRLLSLVEL